MTDVAPVNVLIVEDNPRDVELLLRELGGRFHLGNRVLWVKDGVEALEALFGQGRYGHLPTGWFGLVLLDLVLPKISGIELLSAIRQDARTSALPVMLMSDISGDPAVLRAEELGAGVVLAKPVSGERFVEAVAAMGFAWNIVHRPLPGRRDALSID